MAKTEMVTAVENEKTKEEIFYMMNMHEWFIKADEDKRIEIVESLLGPDAPKPDEEFSKKELGRLVNSL